MFTGSRYGHSMAATYRLPALALAVAVLVGACSSDSGSEGATVGDSATTEIATTPATEAPTTAAAPTTTTLPPTVGRPDAREAAQALYDAWLANDRASAAAVADPPAIDGMFAAVAGPYQLYSGCDSGEFDTGGCLFRDRSTNNTIQVDLEKRDGNWVVAYAVFSAG